MMKTIKALLASIRKMFQALDTVTDGIQEGAYMFRDVMRDAREEAALESAAERGELAKRIGLTQKQLDNAAAKVASNK